MEKMDVDGRKTVYLDSAATALARPETVSQAVLQSMERFGNAGRGAHGPAMEAARAVFLARTRIARLVGCKDPSRVVFTAGATHALNIAIGGLSGHVVTTAAEHNSVLRPVYRRGDYTVVPVDSQGRLSMQRLEDAIGPDTGAVILTHASNACGNVYDLKAAAAICERHGVRLVVDAAQSVGHLPIDMDALGIDALCFSGHKGLFGPQGTGCLCLGEGFLPPPLLSGGSGMDSFAQDMPDALPERLEAGTLGAHGIAGLSAGVQHVLEHGEASAQHADALARAFVAGVRALPGITCYGDLDAPVRVPVVLLTIDGMDSAEACDRLFVEHGIAVRAGVHCAPLLHEALGTGHGGALRFSFSPYNTMQEVDLALCALSACTQGV